jgi:hypothetical protein
MKKLKLQYSSTRLTPDMIKTRSDGTKYYDCEGGLGMEVRQQISHHLSRRRLAQLKRDGILTDIGSRVKVKSQKMLAVQVDQSSPFI